MALDSTPTSANNIKQLNSLTKLTWMPSNNQGYCTTGAQIDMEAWASLMRSAVPISADYDSVWTQGNKTACTLNVDAAIANNPEFISRLHERLSPSRPGALNMNAALSAEKLTYLLSRAGTKDYEFKPVYKDQKAACTLNATTAQAMQSVLEHYHIPCSLEMDSATQRLAPKDRKATLSVPTDPLTLNRLFALYSLELKADINSQLTDAVSAATSSFRASYR